MLELRVEKGAPVGGIAFPADWSLEVLVRVVAVAVGVLEDSLPSLPRGVRVLRERTPGIVAIGRYNWYSWLCWLRCSCGKQSGL